MRFILDTIAESNNFKALASAIKEKRIPAFISGLCESYKAFLLMSVCENLSKRGALIVPDEESGEFYKDFFKCVWSEKDILFFPSREYIFKNIENSSHDDEAKRIKTLLSLSDKKYKLVIITADALLQPLQTAQNLKKSSFNIKSGMDFLMDDLVKKLLENGYERCDITEGHGQFSVRGGIVEFYPLDAENPYRIEYFGDTIETVTEYNPLTQRRVQNINSAKITPALEVLTGISGHKKIEGFIEKQIEKLSGKSQYEKTVEILKADLEHIKNGKRFSSIDKYLPLCFEKTESLLDYLNDCVLFSFDMQRIKEVLSGFSFRINEDLKALVEEGVSLSGGEYIFDKKKVLAGLEDKGILMFETFSRSENDIPIKFLEAFSVRSSAIVTDTKYFADDISFCINKGFSVAIMAGNPHNAAKLSEELRDENISAQYAKSFPKQMEAGSVLVFDRSLPSGFEDDGAKFALFSDGRAAPQARVKRPRLKTQKQGEKIKGFSDIKLGDYIVHINYGIGIYEGIHKIEVDKITKDFIKIRYAGSDTLYIPCSQLDLISKYVGAETDMRIKLNRLGTGEWQRTKSRVKSAVKDLAKELIALYSERMKIKGYAFSGDNEWQREFEANFEFEETDDQLRCIDEIKNDMQSHLPMDRLLCGDVGFGKTEVALRAVFKCILDSKQAAILVPTTILAWQHYNTILKRIDGFPIKVELLSRFRSPKQQEAIIKKLRRGEIDVIVGTHRIIQKDIIFKNLGLVIVDEEQRFGVAHKERLKEITKSVDVLTLSATPIPRTLNMALTGIRDMSVIEEPPHDRHPVNTYVCEYGTEIIIDALKREISRGGQCYYLHNRIETIYRTANKLAELMPNARIDVAHGQMNEDDLALVWERLLNHELDVLVCTTIIETGVDVPNVNTLIIEDADKLGLAQLHQIRGRVGRSARRAFAYFTYHHGKVLTQEATKRLLAIREFTEFGSGIKIAMRDLEIRGAGNVLGAQQHGHMEAVGYDMYLRLLEEAVREEKGQSPIPEQCAIDLSINAYIPEKFIESGQLRIDIYKKVMAIENEEDVRDCLDEIKDRFGNPPNEVLNLLDVALVKSLATNAGICEISQKGVYLVLYVFQPDLKVISRLMGEFKGKLMFSAGQKPYFSLKILKQTEIMAELKKFIFAYDKIKKSEEK